MSQIAATAGVSMRTACRIVRKVGLPYRAIPVAHAGGKRIALTPQEVAAIAAGYAAGENARELSERIGRSDSAILKAVRKAGGKVRGKHLAGRVRRRHSLDEHVFDTIDTPQKAYALGFIATDGHVRKDRLAIALKTGDVEVLEFFRDLLQSTAPIRIHQTKPKQLRDRSGRDRHIASKRHASVTFCSNRLSEGLDKLGMSLVGRKTNSVTPWSGPPDLQRFFWAGAVDGDGSVEHRLRKGHRHKAHRVRFYGNHFMVGGLTSFVRDSLGVNAKPHQCGSIWTVAYDGKHIGKSVAVLIYSGIDFGLSRKRITALS
jgi:hypothetical protein